MLTVFMSTEETPPALKRDPTHPGIPSYAFPEDAARALARAADYGLWRASPAGEVPRFDDLRPEEAAAVIASALGRGAGWLEPDEVERLLRCYGLPVIESRTVVAATETGRAASDLGAPVAVKAIAPGLVHKSDVGAVQVGLSDPAQAQEAAERMAERVRAAGHEPSGFLVQRMAGPGVELLLGVAHDPLFGPVIVCGAGGVTAEVMKDVAVRITPLTDTDARRMLRSLRMYPLLEGFRGAPPVDVGALESLLLRLSAMVEAHAEVVEMDCNPVIAGPDGAVIVDARVRVEAAAPPGPTPVV